MIVNAIANTNEGIIHNCDPVSLGVYHGPFHGGVESYSTYEVESKKSHLRFRIFQEGCDSQVLCRIGAKSTGNPVQKYLCRSGPDSPIGIRKKIEAQLDNVLSAYNGRLSRVVRRRTSDGCYACKNF